MTELEKVLAGLLDEEWGREGTDIALIARPSKLAQFLAPHIERAFRDAGRHGRPDWNDLWAIDVGTESLRKALGE